LGLDAETLRLIDQAYEVEIETTRPDGTPRRTIIWVMVDAGDVFVRSVRGDRGHWFQSALDGDRGVTLIVGDRRIAARAELAADAESVARCTSALERKYAGDPSLPLMLRPKTLATTARLLPA
jgi:hypothetical protein